MAFTVLRRTNNDTGRTIGRAKRRARTFQSLEPRNLLAVGLPLHLQAADDGEVLQTVQVKISPTQAPVITVSAKQDLTSATSSHIDAWFETESADKLPTILEPGDPSFSGQLQSAFADLDELFLEAPAELLSGAAPVETTAAQNIPEAPLDEPSDASDRASSVADFTWPDVGVVDEVHDEKTDQETTDQTAARPGISESAAAPIRGPPPTTNAENSLFFNGFLDFGASAPGDAASSTPGQLVVIDPLLENISVITGTVSGPGIELFTLAADTDPVAQIEAALGQAGPTSALNVLSQGVAGQSVLSDLTIDHNLINSRSADFARWDDFLADNSSIYINNSSATGTDTGFLRGTRATSLDVLPGHSLSRSEPVVSSSQLVFVDGSIEDHQSLVDADYETRSFIYFNRLQWLQ